MIILFCAIGVDEDVINLNLIHHFCRFYINKRPDEFYLILQSHNGNLRRTAEAGAILEEYGLKPDHIWSGPYSSHELHRRLARTLNRLKDGDWMIPLDVDEFLDLPSSLPDFLKTCSAGGFNCVRGRLIDRVAENRSLRCISRTPSLEKQFPLRSTLTETVALGHTGKIVAFQAPLVPGKGHHSIIRHKHKARFSDRIVDVNHYKWDSLLPGRLKKRYQEYRKMKVPWGKESYRLLRYFSEFQRVKPEHISGTSSHMETEAL